MKKSITFYYILFFGKTKKKVMSGAIFITKGENNLFFDINPHFLIKIALFGLKKSVLYMLGVI